MIFWSPKDPLSPWMVELLDRYGLSISTGKEEPSSDQDFFRWSSEDDLVFFPARGTSLSIDWEDENKKYSGRHFSFSKHPLVRALGVAGKEKVVIDGTTGFGSDFFLLWSKGVRTLGVEKELVPCFMTHWNLHTWSFKYDQELPLLFFSSLEKALDTLPTVDGGVLYLDPLFPETKKTAKPKKKMALLRRYGSSKLDVALVWQKSKNLGLERIVVKRPRKGEHLVSGVSYSISSKLLRYDVYRLEGI